MTKEEAIIKVLTQRADIARKVLLNRLKDDGQDGVKFAGYLEGKVDGYEQAIELLKEDIECISIELNDNKEDIHSESADSGVHGR